MLLILDYRRVKALQGEILGLPIGEKGLFQMVNPNERRRQVLTASERVEYITHVLKLMWPFYEPNICKWYASCRVPLLTCVSLVEFLNSMLEELRPQFINSIQFSSLTFGSIPFDITEVRVVKESSDEFVIDCGVKSVSLLLDRKSTRLNSSH